MKIPLLLKLSLFFTLLSISAFAQQSGSIKGKITTSDGLPAVDVSIGLKNKNQTTSTDEQGTYSLTKLKPGKYILRASAIGIIAQEKNVTVVAGETLSIDFVLSENSENLKEVTISGSKKNKYAVKSSDYVGKMPLNNLENPQVYTTISKEVIADQLVFSVDDATRNATGVQKMWEATGRGGDGGAYYSSRGFIMQSKLRNGIAGNVTSRVDAANLERLEIIKGPSATLFGSSLTSYGGLMNRVTKKPYQGLGGEVNYAVGSYNFNRVSVDFNTPIDQKNQIYARVNAAYNYNGTFQDNGFDKGFFIAPSLSYKVNDRLNFQFDAEFSNGTNIGRPVIFFYFPTAALGINRADEAGLDYKKSYYSNDLTQKYKTSNFFAQANYKISKNWTSQTNFTSTYSFSNGRSPYFFLVPNNYPALGNPGAAPGTDWLSRADQSTDNSKINVWEIQQNFNGDFHIGSVRNRIVVGLDFFRQNSDQLFYSIDTFDLIRKDGNSPTYGNFNEHNLANYYASLSSISKYPIGIRSNTYSAFVSDVVNLSDRLMALAALRVDRFDNKGNFDRAGNQTSQGYKQTAYSPKFGLVFQPVKDQVSLFANYQNSFNNVDGRSKTGVAFKPEQANQIEGGVKLNAFGNKLSGTVSYYYIKAKNILRPDPTDQNFSIQNGTKVSKGIEAEIIANPLAGLNIIAGFSYNDNKLVNATPDVEGRRDAYSMAPYAANVWVTYKLMNGALKGLGAGVGGNYASDNKIVNSVSMGQFILPAYTVLNASVFYDHTRYRIGVKADNFTNEKYWIGYGTMNPQQLRSFTGSIAYKF